MSYYLPINTSLFNVCVCVHMCTAYLNLTSTTSVLSTYKYLHFTTYPRFPVLFIAGVYKLFSSRDAPENAKLVAGELELRYIVECIA